MKFILFICSILLVGYVAEIRSLPHHDNHSKHFNMTNNATIIVNNTTSANLTEHKPDHIAHLNHTDHLEHKKEQEHSLNGTHSSGHNHHHTSNDNSHLHNNETISNHEQHHMNTCHKAPVIIECTETIKNRYIFKHLNSTHHQCTLIDDSKCSSSENSFDSIEQCEEQCHHDKHRL